MHLSKIVPKEIIILTAFSVLLNFIYLVWSDSIFSLYILWNIILAFVPFFLSFQLLKYRKNNGKNIWVYILGISLWLLFFPNAPYMVTDIIHVGESLGVPLWFDAVTLFISAWVGVMLGVCSLSQIEELLRTKYSQKLSLFLITLSVFFASIGIYLGRFGRWNSWDIVARPSKLFGEVRGIFSDPYRYDNSYLFIFIFFVFIFITYYAFREKETK